MEIPKTTSVNPMNVNSYLVSNLELYISELEKYCDELEVIVSTLYKMMREERYHKLFCPWCKYYFKCLTYNDRKENEKEGKCYESFIKFVENKKEKTK